MIFVLGSFNHAVSQNLLNVINSQNANLSPTQQIELNAYLTKPEIGGSYLIQFGSLALSVNGAGSLFIDVPDDGYNALTFAPQFVEYVSEFDYIWMGEIQSESADGHILLVSKDGVRTGEINIDDYVYEFRGLTQDKSILVKYKDDFLNAGTCGFSAETTVPSVPTIEPQAAMPPTCNVVRIAFIGTLGTSNKDINAIANTAIAQLNAASVVSGVPSSTLTFQKAGFTTITSLVETSKIKDDLVTFPANAAVIAFKTSTSADLIVFLTNGGYSNIGGQFLGLAPSINVTAGPQGNFGHCIVEAKVAISHKTLCHEVGHLMGGDHSCNTSNVLPCVGTVPILSQHGFVFEIPSGPFGLFKKEKQTLLVTGGDKKRRILRFSNPAVNYAGVATGNASANMAAQLTSAACVVSRFVSDNAQMSLRASAPPYVQLGTTFTASVGVEGGTGPYTYFWQKSMNGVDYSPAGAAQNISVTVPSSPLFIGKKLFLNVNVTDNTGELALAFTVSTILPGFQGGGGNSKVAQVNNGTSLTVFPNPAFKQITIDFKPIDKTKPVKVILFDSGGKQVFATEYFYSGQVETIQLPITISSGLYYLECTAGIEQAISSILIQNQ